MTGAVGRTSGDGTLLTPATVATIAGRLAAHGRRASERAVRLGRPVLTAVTISVASVIDPAAVLAAVRRPGEPWFVLEQPERDSAVVAALGAVAAARGGSPDRFASAAAAWRQIVSDAVCDAPDGGLAGAGPIACGGFAFAADGGRSHAWRGFGQAGIVVPELVLVRRGDRAQLTLSVAVGADGDAEVAVRAVVERAAALDAGARLPLVEPDPRGPATISSVLAPAHFVEAVARAVERIGAGEFEKIVLARAVEVHGPDVYRPEAVLGLLRERYAGCHLFCVGRGDATFLGASPELLIRREGLRASTLALAGSTARSADPAVDAHLGEQLLRSSKDRAEHAIVARRILRALRPHSVWATAAPEPVLAQIAGIQHLATPIRAQLASPVPALELAGLLHPTPAVGAEPAAALEAIPALEGMDRGWFAGPIGWSDAAEDGEFVVGLRSALVTGCAARCFAGVGVVGDSDPAAELAETEIKLGAMLSVLNR